MTFVVLNTSASMTMGMKLSKAYVSEQSGRRPRMTDEIPSFRNEIMRRMNQSAGKV